MLFCNNMSLVKLRQSSNLILKAPYCTFFENQIWWLGKFCLLMWPSYSKKKLLFIIRGKVNLISTPSRIFSPPLNWILDHPWDWITSRYVFMIHMLTVKICQYTAFKHWCFTRIVIRWDNRAWNLFCSITNWWNPLNFVSMGSYWRSNIPLNNFMCSESDAAATQCQNFKFNTYQHTF